MSKKLALIAGLAAVTTSGAALAGAPVVYGKANISLQAEDTDAANTDHFEWKSNASRLGVKGKHKLGGGLKAFYKAEFEIQVDDGSKDSKASTEVDVSDAQDGSATTDVETKTGVSFTQRNIYAGLKGGFGSVKAGKFDTPTKLAIKKVDQFNDYSLGDVKSVLAGENRESNMVQYSSPKIAGGLTLNLALQAGEETGADSNNGFADAISVSAVYKTGDLYLAVAHDSEMDGDDTAVTRLVAKYTVDAFEVGAAIQTTDYSDTVDRTGFLLSGAYKFGANKVKVQYTTEGESEDNAKDGDSMFSVGFDHKLNKKVKVYAFHTSYETDQDDSGKSSTGVGMEVKF